jgi:tRNA(Arg) A34 adenosine deaminase TadA
MATPGFSDVEQAHLRRCVELAEVALTSGDEPFGSVLVDAGGVALAEDRNRVVSTGDPTQHPELALARWAATHMDPGDRAGATVFTSGEHCPMCAAAHAWVGLGRVVYVASSEQLAGWLHELGVPPSPVRALPIGAVVPRGRGRGPGPGAGDGGARAAPAVPPGAADRSSGRPRRRWGARPSREWGVSLSVWLLGVRDERGCACSPHSPSTS